MNWRWPDKATLLGTLTSAIALGATLFYFGNSTSDLLFTRSSIRFTDLELMRYSDTAKQQQSKLEAENARTASLIQELAHLTKIPPPNSSLLARQITVLKRDIDSTNAQLTVLNSNFQILDKSIESNPEKALTVPLLRKDLDDFKLSSQHDIDSLRAEMLRGYELNKWLIGLLLAAIVGIVLKSIFESRTSPGGSRSSFE
jgi:hypothetical protein